MNFVYPNFLWALLLLCIPIIIHLFNFRRYKTVYFSKVDLLTEVIEDSKSGNKLKHLLVLLSRLLAIAALVLAFAQPYLANNTAISTETISSIYIDNSFSMEAEGQDGNLLNEVKNQAIDLVKSFAENDKINLLTTDLLMKDQRFYSRSEIIERIKEISPSPSATSLENVLNLQTDLLNKFDEPINKRIFTFSDFQKTTASIENFKQDEIKSFYFQPKAEQKGNIYIDSIWFETPVQNTKSPLELHFRVQNLSDKPIENLNVKLQINDKDKGFKSISVPAQSYTKSKLTYSHQTDGIKRGHLKIKTSQIFFDDDLFFTYSIQKNTNILIINQTNEDAKKLEQLYAVNEFYNANSVLISQLKQDDFKEQSLIILNSINKLSSGTQALINEALINGASIVLVPGTEIDFNNWNKFLSSKKLPFFKSKTSTNSELTYFNHEDPLYRGVFDKTPKNYKRTKVSFKYPYGINSSNNYITLFGETKSKPFLIYQKATSGGRLFLQNSSLNSKENDFANQALFAATFLRIAETSNFNKNLYYIINEEGSYQLNQSINEKNPIRILNEELKVDIIPTLINFNGNQKVLFNHLNGQIKHADFYKLSNLSKFEDIIAFNYSRLESNTETLTLEKIQEQYKKIGWTNAEKLELNQKGKIEINNIKPKEYWRIFLILALVFLAIEIALIKLWKTT